MTNNKQGFSVIEVLIATSILLLFSPMFISTLRFIQKYPISFTERQNNLGIIQLRRSLSLGINHIVEYDSICMDYKGETMCFEQHETNLIAYPGTQYYLVDVDSLNFEISEGWICIYFETKYKEYQFKLIKI